MAKIVNLAIRLNRPLLVEGEPGCGKTKLASAIADELKMEAVKISVKSTTRAQDLLYRVNSLRRLQDAQTPGNPNAQYVHPYVTLGPLGNVIRSGKRCVVLIDEVDKADIDFPNDLLDVLEDFRFTIDDLPPEEEKLCQYGREVKADEAHRPIVVITSNQEKKLPEPFLRRCLYIHLKFPKTPEELRRVVEKNFIDKPVPKIAVAAAEKFMGIRKDAAGSMEKLPSTSELIDWIHILSWEQRPEALAHWETLFKTARDLEAYQSLQEKRAKP
ncbi:MAG: MoxR family ATPase [Bryobacteraceae bacterium]|nr:MoxR family ATPase [Bryobacteraceae bacterium]